MCPGARGDRNSAAACAAEAFLVRSAFALGVAAATVNLRPLFHSFARGAAVFALSRYASTRRM